MQQVNAKAWLVLLVTFVLGAAVGVLALAAVQQRGERDPVAGPTAGRRGGPEGPDGRGGMQGGRGAQPGFVEAMLHELGPRDSAQAAALRPLLEAADARNRGIVDGARRAMGDGLRDSLRPALVKVLDRQQLQRFDDFLDRSKREGRGPPGLEGPPGRGGRDGRGPPTDGRGPPPDGRGPPRPPER